MASQTTAEQLITKYAPKGSFETTRGSVFGLFRAKPTKGITGFLGGRINVKKKAVYPLLTHASLLTDEETSKLGDLVNNDSALFKMNDDTVLIGDSGSVVLLTLTVRLKEDYQDLPKGTYLYSYDEDFTESDVTLEAYSQDGCIYGLPFSVFELVNYDNEQE